MMENNQVINVGEKFHLIMRRQFKEDIRRHFAGQVVTTSEWIFRAEGYSFVFDPLKLDYRRLASLRTRIFGITDTGYIMNILPPDVIIDKLYYHTQHGPLVITDGAGFSLEVNEFNATT